MMELMGLGGDGNRTDVDGVKVRGLGRERCSRAVVYHWVTYSLACQWPL